MELVHSGELHALFMTSKLLWHSTIKKQQRAWLYDRDVCIHIVSWVIWSVKQWL